MTPQRISLSGRYLRHALGTTVSPATHNNSGTKKVDQANAPAAIEGMPVLCLRNEATARARLALTAITSMPRRLTIENANQ